MPVYSEYVGLTAEVASLIEAHRKFPNETKCDMLLRVLAPPPSTHKATLDLGQGVHVYVGEKMFLFLHKKGMKVNEPNGTAVVGNDGLYVDGHKVVPKKKSFIQPAMLIFQEKLKHRNAKGEIKALSAYRQWHVIRDGKLKSLDEIKDPKLRRRRGALKKIMSVDLDL